MGEMVEFASNGGTGTGYLATPSSGASGAGASGPGAASGAIPLVVIQEWWGLVPHIKDVCDRFAAEGFAALAPDLYHGESTAEPDEAGKLMMALNIEQAAKDMSGAVDELMTRTGRDRVGVTGFCMGGGLALVLATHRPDAIKAAVPWYGLIPWEGAQPDWSRLDAAVLGHYAEEDEYFTPELARGLERQLKDLGKDATIEVHPGVGHAYFNDTRPEVYDAEVAAECFRETVDFLRSRLG
jgi:carboxymethylenebutenolidase